MEEQRSEVFDIVIIGAGISGLGLAYEAIQAGYSVCLLEKGQCGAATSAASLRIIHGGFRYLQNFNFKRVIESMREHFALHAQYPSYIEKLPCIMPLQKCGLKSKWPAWCGVLIYRCLARLLVNKKAENGVRSTSFIDKDIPLMQGKALHSALFWTDAAVPDHEAFVNYLVSELKEKQVQILEEAKVTKLTKQSECFLIIYEKQGQQSDLKAKVVVNTTGPWLNTIEKDFESSSQFKNVKWCKGFNIVLNRQLEKNYGIGLQGEKGRLYFMTPRKDHSVIGTWYLPYDLSPDEVSVSEEELNDAINSFNQALDVDNESIRREDVAAIEVGVLPMKSVREGEPVLYGSEQIVNSDGYIEVLSTKYTTYRNQARKVLKTI